MTEEPCSTDGSQEAERTEARDKIYNPQVHDPSDLIPPATSYLTAVITQQSIQINYLSSELIHWLSYSFNNLNYFIFEHSCTAQHEVFSGRHLTFKQ